MRKFKRHLLQDEYSIALLGMMGMPFILRGITTITLGISLFPLALLIFHWAFRNYILLDEETITICNYLWIRKKSSYKLNEILHVGFERRLDTKGNILLQILTKNMWSKQYYVIFRNEEQVYELISDLNEHKIPYNYETK